MKYDKEAILKKVKNMLKKLFVITTGLFVVLCSANTPPSPDNLNPEITILNTDTRPSTCSCPSFMRMRAIDSLHYFIEVYNNHINGIQRIGSGPVHDQDYISFHDRAATAQSTLSCVKYLLGRCLQDIDPKRVNKCEKCHKPDPLYTDAQEAIPFIQQTIHELEADVEKWSE